MFWSVPFPLQFSKNLCQLELEETDHQKIISFFKHFVTLLKFTVQCWSLLTFVKNEVFVESHCVRWKSTSLSTLWFNDVTRERIQISIMKENPDYDRECYNISYIILIIIISLNQCHLIWIWRQPFISLCLGLFGFDILESESDGSLVCI